MKKRKVLSAKEFATLGGKATLKKYGAKHFSKIANKRWAKERKAKKVLLTK